GERGGVIVDDHLRTSDGSIFAIGEVALHKGTIYGLVAPGYEMADVLARCLAGQEATFRGGDLSAKLKLLGADVATFGEPFQDPPSTRAIVHEDQIRGVYKRLVLRDDGRQLLGGILVGDARDYARLLHLTRSGTALSETLDELGASGGSKDLPAGAL